MSNLITITRRELGATFNSPIFWVVTAGFLAFYGLVFGGYFGQAQGVQASLQPLLSLVGTVLLFVAPILAMRLLADEQRLGTIELLVTSPVRDWQVVFGKWLGAMLAFCAMMGLTLIHVLILWRMATNGMALGSLFATYVGIFLLGGALLAVGTLTSALTEDQVIAGFLGVMAVMVLWFLSFLAPIPGTDTIAGKVMEAAGLSTHYLNFGYGVIDSRDLIYFVTLTFGALYIATRAVETRRWR